MADIQFHIKLKEVDEICLLSGNPDRVPKIAAYLKGGRKVAEYRGLVAYKGVTPDHQVPVTVLTTGMGSGSSGIILEEAYQAGARTFIRIGSTGSLQPEDGIGSIFIPHAAIRDEGTTIRQAPLELPATATPKLFQSLCNSAKKLNIDYKSGLVWTTDIYYQADKNYYKKWAKLGATCVEMESSTMFIFAALKHNVKAATVLTSDGDLDGTSSIYSGNIEENLKKFQDKVDKTIKIVIETIDKV